MNTSITVISIFLLVPILIGFLAVRGYKQIVRREQAEAAARNAAAEKDLRQKHAETEKEAR